MHDLRSAVRTLWKNRGFTTFAALSLALGIGTTTALFTLVDGLLLRSLPVRDAERLVDVQQTIERLGMKKGGNLATPPVFDVVRARRDLFAGVVGFEALDRPVVAIDGGAEPSRRIERVSDNFFAELGVAPALGRVPQAGDDAVAVLSHAWWRARFDGRAAALGRAVSIDGRTYTVIGVAPPRFRGLSLDSAADAWHRVADAGSAPDDRAARARHPARASASRGAGAVPAARADTAGGDPLWRRHARHSRAGGSRPLAAARAVRAPARCPLGPGGGRAAHHLHERRQPAHGPQRRPAPRAGDPRRARRGTRAARADVPRRKPGPRHDGRPARRRAGGLGCVSGAVDAAAGGAARRAGVPRRRPGAGVRRCGLAGERAALRARAGLEGFAGRSRRLAIQRRQGREPAQSPRLGRWLVACQVGLSVLLLVGAGLFVQTLRNLTRVDVGFGADRLLQVSLDTRGAGYGRGQVGPLQDRLLARVAAVPGVRIGHGHPQRRDAVGRHAIAAAAAGPGSCRPTRRGTAPTSGRRSSRRWRSASSRTHLHAADFAQGRRLVVVTDSWARRYFTGVDPIGTRIGEPRRYEIVGVVADSRIFDLRTDVGPTMYFMTAADPDRFSALEVRAAGDVDAVAHAVQAAIRDVNPRLVIGVRTMRQEMQRSVATERLVAAVSSAFGLLGLLLAAVGLFGVAAATVAQRTRELGIRMALGASRWVVIREALRDTLLVVAAGLAAGIVVAAIVVRLAAAVVADLLYGLTATDTATVVGAGVVMLLVAAAACLLPARRAVGIDPLAAIREL